MPKRIVILGGGVGGTIVANIVARELHGDEAEITVVDTTGQHAYMPGWLYLPFNGSEGLQLSHDERSLLNRHVKLVLGNVSAIDIANREVTVTPSGDRLVIPGPRDATLLKLPFDYLVIGTGARLAPEDLTGLTEGVGKWHDFYSLEGALKLRTALHNFEGGRIVIAVGGIPVPLPTGSTGVCFSARGMARQARHPQSD